MTTLLELLALLMFVSLVDCVTTELYFKPKWRAPGANAKFWDNAYHIRTVIMFTLWYWVIYIISPGLLFPSAILHACGWEDFLYAVWVPLFVKAEEAWKYQPGYHIGPWIFPYEWHWLSEYDGFWKFLKYFCVSYWFGGSRVKFQGMLVAMTVGFLTVYIFWIR